jgi:hypothetical protein
MRNYATNVYDYVDKKTGAHIVKAITMYAGKTVSAYAKCDPKDVFDLEFGKKVALKRLDIKIAQKRYASMKTSAKYCRMNLEYINMEKRRLTKVIENAESAALDRKVDIKNYEAELAEMFKSL